VYFLIITAAQLTAQFATLGLISSNTYYVAQDPSLGGRLLANSIWISFAVGIVSAAVVAPFLDVETYGYGVLRVFVPILAVPFLLWMLTSNLLVGLGRVGAFNAVQILGPLLTLCLFVAVYVADWGLWGLLAAVTVATVASALVGIRLISRIVPLVARFDTGLFLSGFQYAMRAYVATLIGFLVLRGVVLMMNRTVGPEQIGYFSVASQIADALIIVPQAFALVLFPRLVSARSGRWHSAGASIFTTAILMAPLCVLFYWLAPFLLSVLFGPQFASASSTLRWLLPGVFCLSLVTVLSQYFAATGFPWRLNMIWLVGLCVTTLLAWNLMPTMQADAASVGLSGGYLTILLLLAVSIPFGKRLSSIEPRAG
jgi:O-antigen/teichoic acid export membrane protein